MAVWVSCRAGLLLLGPAVVAGEEFTLQPSVRSLLGQGKLLFRQINLRAGVVLTSHRDKASKPTITPIWVSKLLFSQCQAQCLTCHID